MKNKKRDHVMVKDLGPVTFRVRRKYFVEGVEMLELECSNGEIYHGRASDFRPAGLA